MSPALPDRPSNSGADIVRLYATVVGVVLVLGGITGFFYEGSFNTGPAIGADEVLGVFAVNGWTNIFHVALGLILLAGASVAAGATGLGVAVALVVAGIWGLRGGGGPTTLADSLTVDSQLSVLHLVFGLAGIAAAASLVLRRGGAGRQEPEPPQPGGPRRSVRESR